MATKPGHARTDSGHLPLGGSLLPGRSRTSSVAEANGSSMARSESSALLLNAPSLQPQAFGELLEQARQVSGQLTGPSIHSLEIAAEPGQEAGPNKSWDNTPSSRRRTQSWGGASSSKQVSMPTLSWCHARVHASLGERLHLGCLSFA